MAYSKDRNTGFSNQGFRIRRVNPDGSYPAVDNHLGFAGTVNLSTIAESAKLSFRWDGVGSFSDVVIDLTAAGATPAATTVAEVATALNLVAGFSSALLASADVGTGRLKIANAVGVTGKTYLELKGDIAVALGFGQYGDAPAMGTAFVDCFDDTGAVGLPKESTDREVVEQENSKGQKKKMIIDATTHGINPSIALLEEIYELKCMLMGGVWDDTDMIYTPPTSQLSRAPLCAMEVFEPKYAKGSMHRGDVVGYKMTDIPRMTGREGDLATEVKGWATYQYDCAATEYMVGTTLYPAYTEKELTIAQAQTLGIV